MKKSRARQIKQLKRTSKYIGKNLRRNYTALLKNLPRWYIVLVVVAGFVGAATLLAKTNAPEPVSIPQPILNQVNTFNPYYFEGNHIPGGFELQVATASYDGQILRYVIQNPRQQIVTVTEQALPYSLTKTKIQGTEHIPGLTGKVVFSYVGSRTIATYITEDEKTLIILNTPDKIDIQTIKSLLLALKPIEIK